MTEGRETPAEDQPTGPAGEQPAGEQPAGEAPSPPPPGGSPPPTAGWVPPFSWAPVDPNRQELPPGGGTLQVGSAFGRVLDNFAGHPLVFIALALPSVLIGAASIPLYADPRNLGLSLPVGLLTLAIGVVFSVAMVMATDELRAGRAVSLGSLIGRAAGRSIAAFLSTLVTFLGYIGILLVPTLLGVVAIALGGVAGALIGVIVVIAGFVLLAIVAFRWMLAQPAIALDGQGPIQGLNRSWAVTRGNLWRLFGLFVLLGLLVLPLSIGLAGVSVSRDDQPLAIVLTALASFVVGPLFAIALSTAYADLTGRPVAELRPGRSPMGRGVLVAAILAVGAVSLVIGVPKIGPGLQQLAISQVPTEDQGKILAGTTRNPLDPCKPLGVKAEFSTGDSIYIGGYFTKAIASGGSATITIYVDGALRNNVPLTAPSRAVACYYEADPIVGAAPGTYRLVVTYGGETIGEGQFTVR